ncbi:(2Fe-2S)-binding protein [Umezawaea beigongshangensis]|uniref:(2Fe-2S)-binding protein n=1 Tax=Umezawaea beigongshangensis TaxID=2780383 RepID=UPI0018F11C08|nr:(2Fe-2S)-binding protein [Umezawaea beigongshangensis]
MRIRVNGDVRRVDAPGETPTLWALRDGLGVLGPKYGCGIGACGACTSLLDGRAFRPCSTPVTEIGDREITTVEGLSRDGSHPVQRAWAELDVPQCGYCQAGQMMSAVALLRRVPAPTDADVDEALRDNVCRCGTHSRIRAAVHRAARLQREERDR